MDSIGRETAIEFAKRVELAMSIFFSSTDALRPFMSKEQFRTCSQALGEAIAELDFGVLEIIYRCHPDLRPDGMKKVFTLRQIEDGKKEEG